MGRANGTDHERVRQRHFALQRLLHPLPVVVPYAERLAELLDCQRVELRRAFPQILSMIQAVTLLHQYQRVRDAQDHLVATAALLCASWLRASVVVNGWSLGNHRRKRS